MPQNNMPMKFDPLAVWDHIEALARDSYEAGEFHGAQMLREAVIQLAQECKLMAIGQTNIARNLQEHIDA